MSAQVLPSEFYRHAQRLIMQPGLTVEKEKLLQLAREGERGIVSLPDREEKSVLAGMIDAGVEESFLVHLLLAWPLNQRIEVASWVAPAEQTPQSPLLSAAFHGYAQLMQALIDHGADPKTLGASGDSLLYFAAASGFIEAMEVALAQGLNIDHRNDEGRSPLMQMCMLRGSFSRQETMALLLEHGASIHLRCHNGLSARDLAVEARHKGALELLDAAQARVDGKALEQRTKPAKSMGGVRRV